MSTNRPEFEHDLPDTEQRHEIKCLDHGFVALDAVMGSDRTPAQTARTSFRNRKERTADEDAKLTDYLIRNRHTTPIEFCQVRFYMKMPIFVARQLVRHRTASINEISYRYVQAAREFYVPAPERCQRKAETNKQGSSSQLVDDPERVRFVIELAGNMAFDAYETLLNAGLAPELARTVLPCGTYTEWYWQNDLHNTLHMLGLRLDPHAQYEIRVYAEAMLQLLTPIYPTIIASWKKARGIE
jgi:thymidylate synthase (FAD)